MNNCKTCLFRDERGYCRSEKIAGSFWQSDEEKSDMLVYSYPEDGWFWVGEYFGCVHHKEKDIT